MAEVKMAIIIKLDENEWVWVRLNYFESESERSESVFEWIWEKIRRYQNPRWQCLNPTWQNSRWLASSNWVRMNEWSFLCKWWEPILASVSDIERKYQDGWIQDGQIQDGRIQDGCHHQVRWEWMSLSQIELVWVRVRVEWECFCVYLREDKKMSESKMAVSESNMTEFKMAAIIKLSQNEWVKCFVQMMGTNLGKCEWVWKKILRWQNPRYPNSKWQNSRWLPSSS